MSSVKILVTASDYCLTRFFLSVYDIVRACIDQASEVRYGEPDWNREEKETLHWVFFFDLSCTLWVHFSVLRLMLVYSSTLQPIQLLVQPPASSFCLAYNALDLYVIGLEPSHLAAYTHLLFHPHSLLFRRRLHIFHSFQWNAHEWNMTKCTKKKHLWI